MERSRSKSMRTRFLFFADVSCVSMPPSVIIVLILPHAILLGNSKGPGSHRVHLQNIHCLRVDRSDHQKAFRSPEYDALKSSGSLAVPLFGSAFKQFSPLHLQVLFWLRGHGDQDGSRGRLMALCPVRSSRHHNTTSVTLGSLSQMQGLGIRCISDLTVLQ